MISRTAPKVYGDGKYLASTLGVVVWEGECKLLLILKVRTLRGCVACGELLLHAGEGGYSLSSEVSIAWSLMSGGRPG